MGEETPRPTTPEAAQGNNPQSPAEASLNALNQLPPIDTASSTNQFFSKDDVNAMRNMAQVNASNLVSDEGLGMSGTKSAYKELWQGLSGEDPKSIDKLFSSEDIAALRKTATESLRGQRTSLEAAEGVLNNPGFVDAMRAFMIALSKKDESSKPNSVAEYRTKQAEVPSTSAAQFNADAFKDLGQESIKPAEATSQTPQAQDPTSQQ
jgi:hypothetical protein